MNLGHSNMVSDRHQASCLYEFDTGFCVSYIHYTPASQQVESQLLLTLEKADVRVSFAFFEPEFMDVDKNLVSAKGLMITSVPGSLMVSSKVQMSDRDGCVFFKAKRCKHITPIV